jgi:hypothetical protein
MVRILKTTGMLILGLALLAVCIANFRVWLETGQLPVHNRVYGDFQVSWEVEPAMFAWQVAFNVFLLYFGSLIVIGVVLRKY